MTTATDTIARLYAQCLKDSADFGKTLQSLAVSNPEGLKQYIQHADQIDVDVRNGRIAGYYPVRAWHDWDYVSDPDLHAFVGNAARKRAASCIDLKW